MKFNNKKKGRYRSQLEYDIRRSMPKPKGVKVRYESEVLNYTINYRYTPDFVVSLPSGKKIYIEVKGYFRPDDRRKMANVLRCNPGCDIRMVFPKKHRHNERWCDRNGIKYAIGEVPKEWFYE